MMDAEELRTVMEYDPTTGVLTWKIRPSKRVYPGAVAGTCDKEGYRVIKHKKRLYFAHRLAWLYVYGSWPKQRVDHINGDKADNRIANLRDVSHAQNMCNLHPTQWPTKTGVIGVTMSRNKFRVNIRTNRVSKTVGCFDTLEAASLAYKTAKTARDLSLGLGA